MEFAPAPSPSSLEAGYRAAGFHTDVVIPRLLDKNVTEFGRAVAVIDDTREVTWAELADAARRVAGLLDAHGIGPGDVVVWQLPNWWEALAVAHGVWAAGAISVPVVPIYREHELAMIMAAVQPSAVIGPPEFRGHDHVDMLHAAARAAGVEPTLRVVVRGEATGWLSWDDAQRATPFAHDAIDPGAPVTVGFTSGTTSGAKGAVVSTRGMLAVPMRHARAVPYTFRDRGYMPAPVSHITGLLMAVTLPLVSGCSVLLAERWDAPKAVVDMVRHGVTYSGGAAVFIQELVEAVDAAGMDSFPLACGYNCGGSAIPVELVERCEALGMKPRRAYGMTECPTVSASVGDDGPEIRLGTDGRILPGVDVRVVDTDGRDVARGAVGEFLVRGPQRALGYLDPQHTRDGFDADGWFRSGDLGIVDAEGCITVTGRIKDIINRGGEKLSAQEIEALLRRHPSVVDAAVVAAPHPRLGEEPAAFMVRRAGETASDDEVRQFLRAEGIAPQKIPRIFVTVDELPRTASGKVKKYELVELLPPTSVR
jgi:acyl-CoA synthetase (AMP-forming)/AMP-acid ligase II